MALETLRRRIEELKEARPVYAEILGFYQRIREEQDRIASSLMVARMPLRKGWKDLLAKKGLPLVSKEDFPLDLEACTALFYSLCRIAQEANAFLSEQTKKIEETIRQGRLRLEELLRGGLKEGKIEQAAKDFGFDQKVLLFLVRYSLGPSIDAGMRQASRELGPGYWSKGICPVCGSLPFMSLIREEVGRRSFLCSFCGAEWGAERRLCPFCGNQEQGLLHYFHAEGEASSRIDCCENCHQYIKTIDLRVFEAPEPPLEDLATLHLDFLASQKGYWRPVPMLWTG